MAGLRLSPFGRLEAVEALEARFEIDQRVIEKAPWLFGRLE